MNDTKRWGRLIPPSPNRYPARWLKVERDTGCVLGEFTGAERPRGSWDESRVAIVPTKAVPE